MSDVFALGLGVGARTPWASHYTATSPNDRKRPANWGWSSHRTPLMGLLLPLQYNAADCWQGYESIDPRISTLSKTGDSPIV